MRPRGGREQLNPSPSPSSTSLKAKEFQNGELFDEAPCPPISSWVPLALHFVICSQWRAQIFTKGLAILVENFGVEGGGGGSGIVFGAT